MHPNAALLSTLFAALDAHDHEAMAACYHPEARFRDIAFDRHRRGQIHDMWRMICSGDSDIRVLDVEIVEAGDRGGRARVVEKYRFGASKDPPRAGRRIVNAIDSRFGFEDGLIRRQDDDCDAKAWARQALGDGVKGFLAGRIRFLRSRTAETKLAAFLKANPG